MTEQTTIDATIVGQGSLDEIVKTDGRSAFYDRHPYAEKAVRGAGNVMVGFGVATLATVYVPAMIATWPFRKLGKYLHDRYAPNEPLPEGYSDKLFSWK
jgi:hypothetical protein